MINWGKSEKVYHPKIDSTGSGYSKKSSDMESDQKKRTTKNPLENKSTTVATSQFIRNNSYRRNIFLTNNRGES